MTTQHNDVIRLGFQATVAKVHPSPDAESVRRSVDVIASTSAEDAYGDVVAQDWNLKRYAANPVVLWNHGQGDGVECSLPIGYAEGVEVVDGQLKATINFVDEKANPLAARVYEGVTQGSIRGVSVGFRPGVVTTEKRKGRDVVVLGANELLEMSMVPIPANAEAVAEMRAKAFGLRSEKQGEKRNMEALLKALGLGADASEADALQALHAVKSARDEVIKTTGQTSDAQALGTVAGWREKAAKFDELAAEVAQIRTAQRENEVAAILDEAHKGLKITPANRLKFLEVCGSDASGKGADPIKLRALVDALPAVANASHATTPAAVSAVGDELTAEQKAVAKMLRLSEADFRKSLTTRRENGALQHWEVVR